MRNRGPWIAFLLMCFAVTGLTGLFGTYGTAIPLQRALLRSATLDQVLEASAAGDQAGLEALRPALGDSAAAVLSGPGPVAARVAAARRVLLDESGREERSVAYRIRLMLCVVTGLAAALGAGILAIASKPVPPG